MNAVDSSAALRALGMTAGRGVPGIHHGGCDPCRAGQDGALVSSFRPRAGIQGPGRGFPPRIGVRGRLCAGIAIALRRQHKVDGKGDCVPRHRGRGGFETRPYGPIRRHCLSHSNTDAGGDARAPSLGPRSPIRVGDRLRGDGDSNLPGRSRGYFRGMTEGRGAPGGKMRLPWDACGARDLR